MSAASATVPSRQIASGDPQRALVLAIETAGSTCSAAVARGNRLLAAQSLPMRHGHAEALLPIIDQVIKAAGVGPAELDIVAVATGPGGFTGIRVGLAAAHGIALASGAELSGISSFAAVAAPLIETTADADAVLLVALDSRRDDLYVQLFRGGAAAPLADAAAVLPQDLPHHVVGITGDARLRVAGDAAAAAAAVLLGRAGITVVEGSAPDALGVLAAVHRRLRRGVRLDPARPFYLRPPDVSFPKRPRPLPSGP